MTTTNRMPWDNRRLPAVARRALTAAGVDLTDEKIVAYVKNRNDYEGYNVGRVAVDAALNAQAEALHRDSERIAETIRRAAWQAEKATQRYDQIPHADGADALVALSGTLAALQQRVEALAAAIGVRADDDEADAALHRFSDALAGRGTTPVEG